MLDTLPLSREIVLIGGGHTHALLLRRWGMKPLAGARLTLINPAATAPYTGMLPGFVAGHYARDTLEIDLVRLARFAGARTIIGEVTCIDRDNRLLTVPGRTPVSYDIASFDIGITSDMPDLDGFTDHAIAAKPLGPFATRWQAHLDNGGGPVAVIGGGVGGVELALAMQHAMGATGSVTVIEAGKALQDVGPATRSTLIDALRSAQIDLLENTKVTEITENAVVTSDDREIPASLTVGAAGARPFDWLSDTGLALHEGYIAVDETLRSTSDPAIFAAGDCAHLTESPRPKAGVFAVRAAPILTHNLQAAASGKNLKPFRPQKHYLKLISLGRQAAVADKWNRSVSGDWAWTWKDRIDRAFMDRLSDLPQMKPPPLPASRALGVDEARGPKPLCGGCGAKLGSGVLDRVLGDMASFERDDILTGTGDDAAVLDLNGTQQVFTTDHLRAFWNDPWLMGRITAIHALGDVWAMGAAPQAALAHISLPRMAEALQEAWLREIMESAAEVFNAEGAAIVGGHSTLGAELVVGFSITGLTSSEALTLQRAQEGDALLLSRPLGSGTMLAAEMEGKASGNDVVSMLEIMGRPQGDAAAFLTKTAHAMTDVTGFGLAGHVARMARASALSARIELEELPLFEGAEALAEAGIRSSIWQANRDAISANIPDTARGVLLFDPQTAGGLLAALPGPEATKACSALRDMGHSAAVVGHLVARQANDLIAH